MPFERYVGGRATFQYGAYPTRVAQAKRNYRTLYDTYANREAEIQALVDAANRCLLSSLEKGGYAADGRVATTGALTGNHDNVHSYGDRT